MGARVSNLTRSFSPCRQNYVESQILIRRLWAKSWSKFMESNDCLLGCALNVELSIIHKRPAQRNQAKIKQCIIFTREVRSIEVPDPMLSQHCWSRPPSLCTKLPGQVLLRLSQQPFFFCVTPWSISRVFRCVYSSLRSQPNLAGLKAFYPHVVISFFTLNWSIVDFQCAGFWVQKKVIQFYIYIHVLFHILSHYGLLPNIDFCSLCPCGDFSFLHICPDPSSVNLTV